MALLPGCTVAVSDAKGRHVLASSGFQTGDAVLSQEPYAAVLYDAEVERRCHHSFELCDSPLRCSRCKFARYKGKEAQRAAWHAGHKEECAALASCSPRVPPASVRLAALVMWRKGREERGEQPCQRGAAYADIESLQHHWDKLSDDRKQTFAQMAVLTRQYSAAGSANLANPGSDTRTLAYLLARFACNNHTICDAELQALGVGIYPAAALVNHACIPNAVQTFEGSRICFRAARPIQPGEEVTISYVELAAPRAERRRALLTHYHFDIDAPSAVSTAGGEAHQTQAHEERLPPPRDHVLLRIRSLPPSPADAMDTYFAAVREAKGAAKSLSGSGLTAIVPEEPASAVQHSAAGTSAGDSDEEVSLSEAAVEREAQGAPAVRLEVDAWGPAFVAPGGPASPPAAGARQAAAMLADVVAAHQAAQAAMAAGQPGAAISQLQAALALADGRAGGAAGAQQTGAAVVLGGGHVWRMRLLEALLRAAIGEGASWQVALRAARALEPIYTAVYPAVWPNLALHYATLAKLKMLEGSLAAGATAAQRALAAAAYAGGQGGLVAEALRLRAQAHAELRAQEQQALAEEA